MLIAMAALAITASPDFDLACRATPDALVPPLLAHFTVAVVTAPPSPLLPDGAPAAAPVVARRISGDPLVNLSLLVGGAVFRETQAGRESPAVTLGFRPEIFTAYRHVAIGAFLLAESTLGRNTDTVLGAGPALLVSGGHAYGDFPWPIQGSGVTVLPGFYARDAGGWQPGLSLALAGRWRDRYGLGVEGRYGLGANRERALIVRADLDLLAPMLPGLVWLVATLSGRTNWLK